MGARTLTTYRKSLGSLHLNRQLLWPALITVAAMALRLWQLGAQSLWFDEAQTLFIARLPLDEIVQRAYRPPLYHYLLHFWRLLVPDREFWLRLPSALSGVVVVPLIYGAATRLYSRRVAMLAAALAAISPVLVWYSQELRMYSLMAAEYAALLWLLPVLVRSRTSPPWGGWIVFCLLEIAALYTHYYAIPFLVWLALAGALGPLLLRRWRTLAAWCGVHLVAAVAFVPWLLVIGSGRGGVGDYVGAEVLPVVTEVPGARQFAGQLLNFYVGGSLGADGALRWLVPLAALSLAAAALALVPAIARWAYKAWRREADLCPGGRYGDLCLLLVTCGPVATALLMYHYRPGVVHPRHLMMLAVPLAILTARAGDLLFSSLPGPRGWRAAARGMGLIALVAFAAASGAGLTLSYTDSGRQRPDTRALAQHVQTLTGPGDAVILPYIDYAFDHYYQGAARSHYVETRVGDADLFNWFLPRIQGARRAVLLRWVDAFSDARDALPWLLQRNGRLVQRFWQAQRWVSVYDLDDPLTVPSIDPVQMRVDPLRLQGLSLPEAVPADQPIAVALEWTTTAKTPEDLRASVRILDQDGTVVAADDRVLLSEHEAAPTSRWPVGLSARNYHFLSLPVGTPPLTYSVAVSVYHDQKALDILNEAGAAMGTVKVLGSVQVLPPATYPDHFPSSMPMVRIGREVAPGLILEGFDLGKEKVRAGEALPVTLYWKAQTAPLQPYQPLLLLRGAAGGVLGEQRGHPASGRYPCSRWRKGELVTDRRVLLVAPEAASGLSQLALQVGDGVAVTLGSVTIEQADRQYAFANIQHPLDVTLGGVARLMGYELEEQTVRFGEPLRLTLYWQAVNDAPMAASYTVFAHLLDPQEHVIAQHDGTPAGGAWPSGPAGKKSMLRATVALGRWATALHSVSMVALARSMASASRPAASAKAASSARSDGRVAASTAARRPSSASASCGFQRITASRSAACRPTSAAAWRPRCSGVPDSSSRASPPTTARRPPWAAPGRQRGSPAWARPGLPARATATSTVAASSVAASAALTNAASCAAGRGWRRGPAARPGRAPRRRWRRRRAGSGGCSRCRWPPPSRRLR